MTKCIEINFISKKFLNIIFLGLFEFLRSLFVKYYLNDCYCPFLMNFLMFSGEATLIIIYYIEKKLTNIKQKNIVYKENNFIIKEKTINQKYYLYFIFLCMIGDFISFLLQTISKITDYPLCIRDLYIIISMLFCYFLLKFHYYKHHIVSIVLVFIGIIIKFIIQILNEKKLFFWLIGFVVILAYISMAIQECIEKKLMYFQYINPYYLISIEGFMGMIFSLILLIATNRVKTIENSEYDIKIYFKLNIFNSFNRIMYLIVYYILNSLVNLFRMKIVYEFTPCHKTICFLIVDILQNIVNISDKNYYYYFFISYPFPLFGFLLFNDLIIIHLYNLHYNTIKYIDERSKIEEIQI
jgi:hypothetical protein